MFDHETWEIASFIVTVVGLPLAILVFALEQRRERQNEAEELYQRLADEYTDFLKLALQHADLHLLRRHGAEPVLNADQRERKLVIFELLVSLFERAFILVYEEHMSHQTRRLWQTWEDYMRFWCRREDFRSVLPELLEGEDPDFTAHIRAIVADVVKAQADAAAHRRPDAS